MKRIIAYVCLMTCPAVVSLSTGHATGQAANPCEGYKAADLKSPLPFLRLEQCRARCLPRGRAIPSDAELQACIDGRAPSSDGAREAIPTAPPAAPPVKERPEPAPRPSSSSAFAPGPAVASSFANDAEGWTGGSFPDNGPYGNVIARAPVRWNPGAGRSGGALSLTDPGPGNFFFEAPGPFLGDKRAFSGGVLRYDVRSEGGELFDEADVILIGAEGPVLVYRAAGRPDTGWLSVTVPLVESAWTVERPGGRAPTRDEFVRALSNIRALRIRGEYRNGPETGWLANVTLMAASPTRTLAPAIEGIIISDAADRSGHVSLSEKPALDRKAPKIYVTVQVADAIRGSIISVTLTYLGNNASLGPLNNEVTVDGNVAVAFSFTNAGTEWPIGNFRATVRLPDGTARTKDFGIE